jgi:Pyridoxamine 5'-phosphate oxidase
MEDSSRSRQFSEIDEFVQARVVYIATVRKDGTQSKAAPLWFTITHERTILVQSGPDSWHTRRIRRGSPVLVWMGRNGPAFIGRAQLTDNPIVIDQIIKDYPRKYLMARLGWHRPGRTSFARGERVAIMISLLHALPRGFRSQPGAPAPALYSRL